MRRLLFRSGLGITCLCALFVAWVAGARPLSMMLDRLHAVEIESQAITRLGVADAERGMLQVNELPMSTANRGHEHSGRWSETVDSLGLKDAAIFAWDARGHGRSPGARGAARDLTDVIKDVDAFVRHLGERYEIATENMILLAHSLAAVTVAAWVHDYAPTIGRSFWRQPRLK